MFVGKYEWLDRLVNEKWALKEKIDKLHAYLCDRRSVDENGDEARDLLLEQEKVMDRYLGILERRIEIGLAEFGADFEYWRDSQGESKR